MKVSDCNNLKNISDNNFSELFINNFYNILKYYIHMGYSKESIFYEISKITIGQLNNICENFDNSYDFLENCPSSFEFEKLMCYTKNNNFIEETRGNKIGTDGKGRTILEIKEGWIPKYPFEVISMKDSGKKVWAVHTKETLTKNYESSNTK